MKPVAIIGAGVTGLTAAYRLQLQGVPVTVYESSGRVGGVIRSHQQAGFLAEFGPNSILETSPLISKLVQDLHLESRRLYSDPKASNRYVVKDGKPVRLPDSPLAFFTSSFFSPSAKFSLLREPFISPAPEDREESVEQFVLRRLGREFLNYAINPMVAGVYAGDPARLSVTHAFPKLRALEKRYGSLILGQLFGKRERERRGGVSKQEAKKFSFDKGLQVLTDTLSECLADAIQLKTSVVRVAHTGSDWRLSVQQDGRYRMEEHAAVLFATPAHKLGGIQLISNWPVDFSELSSIHHPPVASVVLGFRREDVAHPLDGFGMLIPEVEKFRILGTLFSSSLFPDRAPEGCVTLTSYLGGARAPELALQSEEQAVQMTLQDLRPLLGVRGTPVFQHHALYRQAIPQYNLGYGYFKEMFAEIEARCPGLYFAGHYRDGISLGDSIVSAHRAVERIANGFQRSAAGKTHSQKMAHSYE